MNEEEIRQLWVFITTKSCNWSYEKEWRVLVGKDGNRDPVSRLYFHGFNEIKLREILIGYQHTEEELDDMKNRLDALLTRSYYRSDPPRIYRTQRSRSKFLIEREPFKD